MADQRTKVFISYSHKDRSWMERLLVHLTPLEREGMLDFWVDKDIAPGEQWYAEIEEAIDNAKVAVLLISPDFLASDFIATEELPRVLTAADKDGLKVIPIFLAPSNVGSFPRIARFQGVNDPQHTLAGMTPEKQDELLVGASQAIIHALETPIKKWKTRRFRRLAAASVGGVALLAALWFTWPLIQLQSMRAVMLIPNFDLRNHLPLVDGQVVQPYRLEITYQGQTVSVDTMWQRIYVLGGAPDLLQRVVAGTPEADRFAAVRTFLRGFNLSPEAFDEAFNALTDGEPAFIETPRMNAEEAIQVRISRQKDGEPETLLLREITIEDRKLTTILLSRGEG